MDVPQSITNRPPSRLQPQIKFLDTNAELVIAVLAWAASDGGIPEMGKTHANMVK
jgi:hypothetical protein